MKAARFLTIGQLEERNQASLQTGPFGTQLKASDYVSEGIPVINVRNIGFGDVRKTDLEYLDESKAAKLYQHRLRKGDIVFGRKGAVERHALIDETTAGWIQGSDCLRLRLDSGDVCEGYLSHYFKTQAHQDWMQALCSFGATMSSLNQDIVRRISFPAPPNHVQKKIAAILSAYDDLIENNQRRIALLEKMAEEIYREWFVRMRFPGHKQVKFEKGVPEGWKLKPFSEVVEINPSERPIKDDEKPYVGMEALSTDSMYFVYKEKRTGNSGSKFRNRDTLFPRITPCLENGKRGFVMTLGKSEVAIGSTEFIVMREKILTAEYIYLLCCFEPFRKHAEISMVGASGRQRVSEECFSFFLVKTPPAEILDAFSEVIKPIFEKIRLLSQKNDRLISIRGQLLPRLISGKLSVERLDIHFPPSMRDTGHDQ